MRVYGKHVADIEQQEYLDRLREFQPELIDALLDDSVYMRRSARLNRSALCRRLGMTQTQIRKAIENLREMGR